MPDPGAPGGTGFITDVVVENMDDMAPLAQHSQPAHHLYTQP
jgi:hypothetical protein